MTQRTVWITGAASGVGRHLVSAFATRGDFVFACDINADALMLAHQEDHWPASNVLCHVMDICDHAQWRHAQTLLADQRSSLDIMLNVAGYLQPGFPDELTDDAISRHLDINVKGLMLGCQTAAQWMQKKHAGHIINFCSLASLLPAPGIAAYSTSKFAVRGYTTALAAELAAHNIAVTLLCPDAIATPMLDLQTQHESAALTFSSGKELSTQDIEDAIFSKVIPRRPFEWIVCKNLSIKIMAKIFLATPDLFVKANNNPLFKNYMLRKAKKNQQRYLNKLSSQNANSDRS